jgi:hypothetical protein
MRCGRCEFENMPGLQKCMRCGSALSGSAEPVQVHPPRQPGWKKPIRDLARRLRKAIPFLQWSADGFHGRVFPEWLTKITRVGCFGAVLSIIPGLAHLVQKRFKSVQWWIVGWAILLLLGLLLFGSQIGMLILGLALGTHIWIAVHSSVLKEYDNFGHRMIAFLAILLFYYMAYLGLGNVIFYNTPGGYSVTDSSDLNIYNGDYLLGSRRRTSVEDITRGSFVLTELSSIRRINIFGPGNPSGYVQIVALPGEKIEIKDGFFVIDDKIQDSERFAVPQWLKSKKISKVLSKDQYFISAQYQGTGYNEVAILNVCIINHAQIEAKAIFRWMPLQRKGFIRESE